ncbi:OmpH family outer membrane protein [Dyella monticola]|uniref:OmpH family outer membrane protein n=1 Tax=Dyella monticola TaxID=1927958 RepID=A0A370WZY1_9GAMM|nr:OmpH family outer membrane protein [Dyella monticola]RDS81723.1 OmpH family outer membrane protein [Dyella monticola]
MRMNRPLITLAAITLAGAPGPAAFAQSSNNGPPMSGPVVSGVCFLSREAIFANAKVGKAATDRLKQLAAQAQSDIDAERKPLDADVQSYRSQASSLTADQRQSREQALSERVQKVQADQTLRGRELEATREKAFNQIAQYAQPVISDAYRNKGCGVLLDRNMVLGGNMTNDLTPLVIQGLDAKVTTISFNLEQLPASSGAPNGTSR